MILAARYTEWWWIRKMIGYIRLALFLLALFVERLYVFNWNDNLYVSNKARVCYHSRDMLLLFLSIFCLTEFVIAFQICSYVFFWLVIFACKFPFAYFLQASHTVIFLKLLLLLVWCIYSYLYILSYLNQWNWYLQIQPLVEPTKIIVNLPRLQYSWHDLVSKSMFFSLIFSASISCVAFECMEIYIVAWAFIVMYRRGFQAKLHFLESSL